MTIRFRSLSRRLCTALVLGGSLLWSHLAAAQLAIIQELPTETPRSTSSQVVSRDDCEMTALEVTVTGLSTGQVASVWVSEATDCSVATERAAGGSCFDTGLRFEGSPQANTTTTLAYRDLLEAFANVEDCRDESGSPDLRNLAVFLLVDVDTSDTTDFATLSRLTGFDLVGPPPIPITAATPVEDGLVISFDGTIDASATGFQVFAEPAAGGGCTAPNLTAGESPAAALAVAQSSAKAPDELEVGLEADVRFAVGMAAVDAYGNRGPLSPLVCATPLGFAALSSNGDGCSLGESGSEGPSGWWLAPLALLALRRRVA